MPEITQFKAGFVTGVGISVAVRYPFQTAKVSYAVLGTPVKFLATDLLLPVGSAIIGSTTAQVTAAAALGYVSGAAIGTGISHVVWGKEGAEDALEFYSGQGAHSEYFDIGGNMQTIATHYKQEFWDAVGGRPY